MKPTYQHQLLTSFYMWFDHFLLDKADAYENFTTDFYNMTPDVRLPDNTIYGSPYKQWVYDRSIAGATTPVIKDGPTTLTPGGAEGLMLDYENGRAIFNDGYTPGGTINGSYSVKIITRAKISPNSNSSKVFGIVTLAGHYVSSTNINSIVNVERDIGGSTALMTSESLGLAHNYTTEANTTSFTFIDSPSSTSAITYIVQFKCDNSSYTANLHRNNAESSMILFEIGA